MLSCYCFGIIWPKLAHPSFKDGLCQLVYHVLYTFSLILHMFVQGVNIGNDSLASFWWLQWLVSRVRSIYRRGWDSRSFCNSKPCSRNCSVWRQRRFLLLLGLRSVITVIRLWEGGEGYESWVTAATMLVIETTAKSMELSCIFAEGKAFVIECGRSWGLDDVKVKSKCWLAERLMVNI